jgi:hypothetical protein
MQRSVKWLDFHNKGQGEVREGLAPSVSGAVPHNLSGRRPSRSPSPDCAAWSGCNRRARSGPPSSDRRLPARLAPNPRLPAGPLWRGRKGEASPFTNAGVL